MVGDAQAMTDDARGGNDTIDTQDHSMYTNVHAFGDVAGDMSGNSHGGSDTITGAVGWRGFDNVYAGDAGGSMSGTAQGGNDTIDISLNTREGSARASGDAIGSISGDAHGGNDNIILTMSGENVWAGASLSGDSSTSLTDNAQGGDDILKVKISTEYTDDARDLLFGDAPTMSGNAHGGNDILTGGAATDFLYGDAKVYDPATPGSITGGKDMLNGGAGNDQLSGGGNSDTFVFNTGSGNDLITDPTLRSRKQGGLQHRDRARSDQPARLRLYGLDGAVEADQRQCRRRCRDSCIGERHHYTRRCPRREPAPDRLPHLRKAGISPRLQRGETRVPPRPQDPFSRPLTLATRLWPRRAS
ncbi:hypothetical protein ACVWZL_002305 [Bradyrhizobium sp. GM2.4]